MKPDLDSIYSELDLQPNCSLEDFQRAYRKQIAELHPDRNSGPQSPETQAALHDLIWLYATVNRFHRRYGRMPGGHASKNGGNTPIHNRDRSVITYECERGANNTGKQSALTWLALFIALLILLALELAETT